LSDPDAPPLDRGKVLAAVDRHQVDYVLVGGLACEAHGSTRQTKDLDLCPAWTPENLTRVAAVLNDLGAGLKIGEGSIDILHFTVDGKTIAKMELDLEADTTFASVCAAQGFRLLCVDHADAWAVLSLPATRADPFDRLIAATARRRGWTVVTADAVFDDLGVPTLSP
jgi:hypothetical protein